MWLRFPGGAVERDFVLTLLHGASSKMLKNIEKACKLLKRGNLYWKVREQLGGTAVFPSLLDQCLCNDVPDSVMHLAYYPLWLLILWYLALSSNWLLLYIFVLCSWLEMDKLGHKSAMRFLYLDTCHLMHTYITTIVPGRLLISQLLTERF